MTAIEKELGIKTSTTIFQNITPKTLKIATEMFLYLYGSPHFTDTGSIGWFHRWFGFYRKLFKTTARDKIILTLNRMLKQDPKGSTHGRVDAVFKTTGTSLSLKLEQIQSVLLGTVTLINEYLISEKGHSNFDYVYSSLSHL